MAGLRQDREKDVPECSGREKSGFREMAFGNADLYLISQKSKEILNNFKQKTTFKSKNIFQNPIKTLQH